MRQMVCSDPPAMRRPRPSAAWRTPVLAAVDTRSAALHCTECMAQGSGLGLGAGGCLVAGQGPWAAWRPRALAGTGCAKPDSHCVAHHTGCCGLRSAALHRIRCNLAAAMHCLTPPTAPASCLFSPWCDPGHCAHAMTPRCQARTGGRHVRCWRMQRHHAFLTCMHLAVPEHGQKVVHLTPRLIRLGLCVAGARSVGQVWAHVLMADTSLPQSCCLRSAVFSRTTEAA